ncbi:hypothetical protein HBI56_226190 [Parastagonospora nodorum]|nr:hypothetical protein HBH52_185930 [Parastagonospora nodorum]KAH4045247.1 hypothetical protein HBH49_208230 [Parastagonospora nodorum]KAH4112769.1 hypothetical protein HBH47_222220 [Parastagonospora nodorum]KAH4151585.1 hypothetical protein HBH43_238540 [Parastagonospora nodorum]KAH4251228.1 hypothetical protein HBI03_227470 [Parastagonospora nodorum]
MSKRAADYLSRWWLNNHLDKIVAVWVDDLAHFGLLVSSKAEGDHRVIKEWLNGSRADVLWLFRRLEIFYEEHVEHNNYLDERANHVIRHDCQRPVFAATVGRVTRYALAGTVTQHDRAKAELRKQKLDLTYRVKPCKGRYDCSLGLPCYYKLKAPEEAGDVLQCENFDPHWWTNRSQAPTVVAEARMEPRDHVVRQQQPHSLGHLLRQIQHRSASLSLIDPTIPKFDLVGSSRSNISTTTPIITNHHGRHAKSNEQRPRPSRRHIEFQRHRVREETGAAQRRLNGLELDVETTDLNLVVPPADKLQPALIVVRAAHDVTRTIPACSLSRSSSSSTVEFGRTVNGGKAGCGADIAVIVTARDARLADQQLTFAAVAGVADGGVAAGSTGAAAADRVVIGVVVVDSDALPLLSPAPETSAYVT